MYRPTYINVDCDVLSNNIKNIISKNKDYKYFIGVVKNNAYHHGIYSIKYMLESGINYLAVSSLEEAIEIRRLYADIPILCLEPIKSEFVYDIINNNVTMTISTKKEAVNLINSDLFSKVKVHLKVDSGMNRLGFKVVEDLTSTYDMLSSNKNIEVEGIYTHLATDGINDKEFLKQVNTFKKMVFSLSSKKFKIIHMDRSYTSMIHDKLDFVNGTRLGISMYGIIPQVRTSFIDRIFLKYNNKVSINKIISSYKLKPVLSCYTEVMELRFVNKGEFVGYGAKYKPKNDEIIATIPCGYADGIVKDFKSVYIRGRSYDIIAECMDMLMIKVDYSIKIGDKVEIIGPHQSVYELSKRTGHVEHKIFTMFSNRIPVVYINHNSRYEVKY